eukprot:8898630-Pyramimonas_sp.AAC.1
MAIAAAKHAMAFLYDNVACDVTIQFRKDASKTVVHAVTANSKHGPSELILVPLTPTVVAGKDHLSGDLPHFGVCKVANWHLTLMPKTDLPSKDGDKSFVPPYWCVQKASDTSLANLAHGFCRVELSASSSAKAYKFKPTVGLAASNAAASQTVEIPVLFNPKAVAAGT